MPINHNIHVPCKVCALHLLPGPQSQKVGLGRVTTYSPPPMESHLQSTLMFALGWCGSRQPGSRPGRVCLHPLTGSTVGYQTLLRLLGCRAALPNGSPSHYQAHKSTATYSVWCCAERPIRTRQTQQPPLTAIHTRRTTPAAQASKRPAKWTHLHRLSSTWSRVAPTSSLYFMRCSSKLYSF
jgi:hypothetical protein